MLQPRLETEQLTVLPNLLATERSRTGFITTDRPDSSQLADLHVYIIPKKVWKEFQHLAQNESMEDAISAGFVRVPPNMKLRDLRDPIEQSCGHETYFPRDFIFLRSVGRCLAIVKARQENELRVKNYRPPQSYAPEIFLLEGRHEDYSHAQSSPSALSSASYVFGDRAARRYNRDDSGKNASIGTVQNHPRKPLRGGKHIPPLTNGNDPVSRVHSSAQSWAKYTQIGSDREESPSNMSFVTSVASRELTKLRDEQERLRQRQAELERMRRAAEDKRARSYQDDEERRRQQELDEAERRRRQERALAELEQEEHRRRFEREEEERRRRLEREDEERRRQARALAEREEQRRRIQQEEEAATRIQASYRGFRDRQTFKERRQNMNRLKRVKEVEEEASTPDENKWIIGDIRRQSVHLTTSVEEKHENQKVPTPKSANTFNDQDGARHEISQIPTRSASIGSTSYSDSRNTKADSSPNKERQRSISISSNSSFIKSIHSPEQHVRSASSKTSKSEEEISTKPLSTKSSIQTPLDTNDNPKDDHKLPNKATKSLRRSSFSSDDFLPETPTEINPEERIIADEIETERREAEARRRQQFAEEDKRKKQKELEDQRRKDLIKRQNEDPESLRARLQELRARRMELERIREEVIKHLKTIHNRITLRRKEARDMWKKRYFLEKKKSPPLEERVTYLNAELDNIHRKTIQTIEGEAKHATQTGYRKEAETGNYLGQITGIHHDIQSLRHQVQQLKLRLTTDVKLRNQAETECRSLKHELNQAKMNLNHIKTRAGL